jgi:hypothetical protein
MEPSLIANIIYNSPVKDDIAVGFAIFNYTRSSRIIMNYLYTVEKMKTAGIPIFTIELVITGETPMIQDAFHIYGSSYLFQKENLLRILETKIPNKYTKLLFLDADIIFKNPDWYDMLSAILDKNDVVHCFEDAKLLDITYRHSILNVKTLVTSPDAKNTHILTEKDKVTYHSGFGWAFTRSWYNRVGYFDNAVIGSGDTFFAYGILGVKFKGDNTEIYDKDLDEWFLKMGPLPVVSYLPVTIYHMFHGSLKNRNYEKRHLILNNIKDSIFKNQHGVFELTNKTYNKKLYEYFNDRKDDTIE